MRQVSGSPLRGWLGVWGRGGVLAAVSWRLVFLVSGDPTLILDSCSVRAKRAGDLTGPNPTDRGKCSTRYHVAVTGDGVPVACAATAANVNNMLVLDRLLLAAFAVMPGSRPCSRTRGMTPKATATCAAALASNPAFTSGDSRAGWVWASAVGRWSAATPGCWRTSAWRCAMTGLALLCNPCSRPLAYPWLQDASLVNSEKRPTGMLKRPIRNRPLSQFSLQYPGMYVAKYKGKCHINGAVTGISTLGERSCALAVIA